MGQYLSAPITEKDSAEGHTESLAFGFSGMQGWRVAMEDAHIIDLNFDPATKTSLFSVFDGHGGRAVAQFAAKHLPAEIKATKAYAAGNLGAAVAEAYLALDVIMDTPEGHEELDELAAPSNKAPLTLFADVDSKPDEGADPPATEGDEDGADALIKDGRGDSDAPGSDGPPSDRRLRRMQSSSEFLASHLQRASIVTPRASPADGQQLSAEEGGDPSSLFGVLGGGSSGTESGEDSAEGDNKPPRAEGAGCTALSAMIRGGRLVVINAGDSRAVLSRRGVAVALTLDHKPILFEEARRIIRAGGFVRDNRINGSLNVSRALGDLDFKRNSALGPHDQMVVTTPDIEVVTLSDGDEFLIMACDGIWDVLSNQEAVDFVRRRIKAGVSLREICEAMCDHCLAPDLTGMCRGADNMSVVVVLFRRTARLDGFWGRMWSGLWCSFNKPVGRTVSMGGADGGRGEG